MKLIENERINKNILNSLKESKDLKNEYKIVKSIKLPYEDFKAENCVGELSNGKTFLITDDGSVFITKLNLKDLKNFIYNGDIEDQDTWEEILDNTVDYNIKEYILSQINPIKESESQDDYNEVKDVLGIEDGSEEEAILNDLQDRNLKDEYKALSSKDKKLYKDLLPINPEIHMSHELADEYAKMYNIDSTLLLWLANIGRHMDNLEESIEDSTKTKKGENKNMTIEQVLRKNKHINVREYDFKVYTECGNNFVVSTNGEVYLGIEALGNYKSTLQTINNRINKMPSDIPKFLKTSWLFSQQISDDEAMQLSAFLTAVYDALKH